jgi:hypothetical protein
MSVDVKLPSLMYFVLFSNKTAFFKLQDIFPECFIYREDSPQLEPCICLRENVCHVNKNCMSTLAQRVYALFEEVCTQSDVILLYFKKRNFNCLGAAVFYRNMGSIEPRTITMNPYAWKMIKSRGSIFQFDPSQDFFSTGGESGLVEGSEDFLEKV